MGFSRQEYWSGVPLPSPILVWNRSIKSLKHEWAAHNAFHSLGIFRKQTAHADLNWPQPWLIRLGYAIIGTIVWPFIK